MEKGIWTTKNGDELKIKEMETSHIKNTIAFLKQNMPDNLDDEYLTSDHWSLQEVYIELGSGSYKKKIKELEKELETR